MSTPPDADETRVRHHLRDLGVSHTGTDTDWWDDLYANTADTHTPTKRTMPAKARIGRGRLPDWRKGEIADLSPDTADTTPDSPDEEADTKDTAPTDTPPTSTDTNPDTADTTEDWADETDPDDPAEPRTRRGRRPHLHAPRIVQAEFVRLERRMQWLLSTGAGAGLGWFVGLEPLARGWIADCAHDTSPTSGLILGVGMVAAGAYLNYRSRGWWPPLAWACRIPFATALLSLCLYAPGVTQ